MQPIKLTSPLEVILGLLNAMGPQSFQEIHQEIRTQVVGVEGLHQTTQVTKAALTYLIALGHIIQATDEYGTVFGTPGDFD
jgi:hypothetical protein